MKFTYKKVKGWWDHALDVMSNDGKTLYATVYADGDQVKMLSYGSHEFDLGDPECDLAVLIDGQYHSILEIMNKAQLYLEDILPEIEQEEKDEEAHERYLKSPYLTGRI